NSPHRTFEDKKRLLRALLSDVTLSAVTDEAANVTILWKDGSGESFAVRRARGVDAYVADQTRAGKSVQQIADDLNAAGVVTASGKAVTRNVVAQKQGRLGLRLKDERRLARQLIRHGLMDNVPRPTLLGQLQEQAPRLGPWDPQRLSEAIRQLRRGVPDVDKLPQVLPAEQDKQ